MLKKVLLISLLAISNLCNAANAENSPALLWNYKSIWLTIFTNELVTVSWNSYDPATKAPFSFISNMNPFTPDQRDLPLADITCTDSPCKAYTFMGGQRVEVPMEMAYPPYISKNFPIKNLVNDVNATFTATVRTTRTNTDICTITFKGDRSVDVKSNDRSFRCTASIDGDVANVKVAQ